MFKKTVGIILLFSFLFSCRSFDSKLLEEKGHFNNSLPTMKVIINKHSIEKCHNPMNNCMTADELVFILKQNLQFDSGNSDLYLSIIIRYSKVKTGSPIGFLVLPLILVGVPINSCTYSLIIEGAIMKSNGSVLKTYTATSSDTEFIGGAFHFMDRDAFKTSYCKALQLACRNLREQMQNDIVNIKKFTR